MQQIELRALIEGARVREAVSQCLGTVIRRLTNSVRVRFDDGRTKNCSAGELEGATKDGPCEACDCVDCHCAICGRPCTEPCDWHDDPGAREHEYEMRDNTPRANVESDS